MAAPLTGCWPPRTRPVKVVAVGIVEEDCGDLEFRAQPVIRRRAGTNICRGPGVCMGHALSAQGRVAFGRMVSHACEGDTPSPLVLRNIFESLGLGPDLGFVVVFDGVVGRLVLSSEAGQVSSRW